MLSSENMNYRLEKVLVGYVRVRDGKVVVLRRRRFCLLLRLQHRSYTVPAGVVVVVVAEVVGDALPGRHDDAGGQRVKCAGSLRRHCRR